MPLITISGSQGQGKTTVLSSLAELGFNVIPHKTSRLILDEWGVSLNQVNKNLALTKHFQEEILKRHENNNREALDNPDQIYFSERSYADIFTYTVFALGSFNEYTEWLNDYYERCKMGQRIYHSVIRLHGLMRDVENDGVRSVNEHFTNSVGIVMDHYLDIFGGNILKIDTSEHEKRISLILDYIEKIS